MKARGDVYWDNKKEKPKNWKTVRPDGNKVVGENERLELIILGIYKK